VKFSETLGTASLPGRLAAEVWRRLVNEIKQRGVPRLEIGPIDAYLLDLLYRISFDVC